MDTQLPAASAATTEHACDLAVAPPDPLDIFLLRAATYHELVRGGLLSVETAFDRLVEPFCDILGFPVCDTCGSAPCGNASFCHACRRADEMRAAKPRTLRRAA
jgi:hypothetical protein